MAQRCTDPCGGGEHRADAGQHPYVKISPGRIALVDGFEYRGGHGEHPGITRGNHNDAPILRRKLQREPGTIEFLAIVGAVSGKACPLGHPRHIGRVADQIGRLRQRVRDFRRHQFGRAGAKAGDGEPAAHGRRPRPWTRIIEK